jgi:hypothetical protein
MRNEVVNSAQNDANSHALKTVNRDYRKNDNDTGRQPPLILAHLAWAVQHEGVKPEKYDALLFFSSGLGNAVAARRSSVVREGFFGIFPPPCVEMPHAYSPNMLIHNKYYSDRRDYK